MSRKNVILHFNRGTSDPDGDGHYDCIPAVDNFQLISGDEGLSWGPVTNISSFLQVRGYSVELATILREALTITEKNTSYSLLLFDLSAGAHCLRS